MTDEARQADRPVRVLLVEDSATQAEATRAMLVDSGYTVDVARDGPAGLAAAERSEFDLVISDVVMPGMDGYELCRRLKAVRGPQLPVVLLTSLTEPMDVVRGLECGADNFLTKPYDPATVRARVAALLESRRLRSGAHMRMGIDVAFLGRRFTITSDREQILDMLMSTFEEAVRANERLRERERELADANALLEEASRAKSDFLSGMSHELRTPLNAILGFAELLHDQLAPGLEEKHGRYLRNIREAGQHLLGLINDVLDLSKVEAGRTELRREVTTVGVVVDPAVESTAAAARERGVAFEADIRRDRAVSVDPARVRQILYNLLSNAVKFTLPGGRVRLKVDVDGEALDIEVADTGIGIPEEKRDRVFGTFERLHEGRSDASGTGLGLALTRKVVELHGGTIGFESREGAGTTFRVRLPGVRAAGAVPSARVLVVEDEPRDSDLVVALAANAGLASEVVPTVAAALDAIRRAPPLGVVLDLRLPDGRGEAVLDALKAAESTRQIPVIVVTVEDDDGGSRISGAHDHLTKPLDHQRLDGWLRQIAARADRND